MPEPGQAPAGTDPNNPPNPGGLGDPSKPPAAGAGTPPAGTPPNPGQDPDKEKNDSELRRARDEAAKFRTEKAALADELKKLKDAQLTEEERKTNRIKELEVEAEKVKADGYLKDVQVALAEAGCKKSALVAKLVPPGETNISKAVEAFKKDNPEFFGTAAPRPGGVDAGAGNGGGADGDLAGMNAIIRRMAGR